MSTLPETYSFVDVETTGTNPRYDRIIEIGIVRVEKGKITGSLNTTLNPGVRVPPEITRLTGIKESELENSPTFSTLSKEILDLLNKSVFVAHNARFDYGFLKHEFARVERKFSSKVFCTVKLARRMFPKLGSYNLDNLIRQFNFKCEHRHRAYDDANVLHQLFCHIESNFDIETIENTFKSILKTPSLPPNLKKYDLNSLPENPGVYIFYSQDNCVLYVGKSTNIKDRIKSHFTNDYLTSRELKIASEVSRIETIETAGELGALLKESKIIKSLQPVYNRRLRRSSHVVVVFKEKQKNGLFSANFARTNFDSINTDTVVAIFSSIKKTKEALHEICKEYMLCSKFLNLEKGKGACFNYQIGYCRGICINKENVLSYNLRYIKAFSKTKVKKWPFDGPIAIEESSLSNKEYHIFDSWIYLGTNYGQNEFSIKIVSESFEWDTYKILKSYLKRKNAKANIIYPVPKKLFKPFSTFI